MGATDDHYPHSFPTDSLEEKIGGSDDRKAKESAGDSDAEKSLDVFHQAKHQALTPSLWEGRSCPSCMAQGFPGVVGCGVCNVQ